MTEETTGVPEQPIDSATSEATATDTTDDVPSDAAATVDEGAGRNSIQDARSKALERARAALAKARRTEERLTTDDAAETTREVSFGSGAVQATVTTNTADQGGTAGFGSVPLRQSVAEAAGNGASNGNGHGNAGYATAVAEAAIASAGASAGASASGAQANGGQASDAQAAGAQPSNPPAAPVSTGTSARRVRLTVSRISPWSVAKLAFLLSFAIGIITVVATVVFWQVVDGLHVFSTIQDFINDAFDPTSDVNVTQYFEIGRMVALAALVAVANTVVMTALATVMALLYNITAALVGGLHVTLTDD
ncbi:MAG: DUF3566 domain-containing protein [Cellulomonadaceae bacterium]|jgi:hypothetical protein|nr:DUF3566 domain-containing protein [Cellulomonadaceae bacterium]